MHTGMSVGNRRIGWVVTTGSCADVRPSRNANTHPHTPVKQFCCTDWSLAMNVGRYITSALVRNKVLGVYASKVQLSHEAAEAFCDYVDPSHIYFIPFSTRFSPVQFPVRALLSCLSLCPPLLLL